MNITIADTAHGMAWPEAADLRRALDAGHMRRELMASLAMPVQDVAVDRVLFSRSRPLVIHYRYRIAGQGDDMALIGEFAGADAAGHLEAEMRSLRKDRRSQLHRDDSQSFILIGDPGLVLRRPGLDSKLPGLRLLHDRAFANEVVARSLGSAVAGVSAHMTLKAHRLGKRAVLCADIETRSGSGRCYLRLRPTSSTEGSEAFHRHTYIARHLNKTRSLRIPHPLHFDPEWGAAFYAAMPGASPQFCDRADAALTGTALREFRRWAPGDGHEWTAEQEIGGLDRWGEFIELYLPDLHNPFVKARGRVATELRSLPALQPRACHRDFHEGQLLLSGATCGLIDFDTWCAADPALDAGNFAAHIRLWELRTGCDASAFEESFLAAASVDMGEGFGARIAVWKRAALLRLAAIYGFTSEPREGVARLLSEAGA